jgi:hypothetical protein
MVSEIQKSSRESREAVEVEVEVVDSQTPSHPDSVVSLLE